MQRRNFLSSTSSALAATLIPAGVALAQPTARKAATVVFVHGAWHGAWCFSPVIQYLAAAGVQTLAIDLPGHGTDAAFPAGYFETPQNLVKLTQAASPLAVLTADDYQKHVTAMIAGLVAKGSGPVVLVGHSLGGVTLNRIGEASPQLIRRLVYLTALNPVSKPSAGDYFSQSAMQTSKALPLFIGDPAKTGAIRFNHRSDDAGFKAASKTAFYADVADDKFAAVAHLLTPDEPAAVFGANATVTAARWGRVPRTYIRCSEDQAIPLAAQDQFIAEADALTPRNRYTVRTLKASHSPFISMPRELAQLLIESLV